MDIILNQEKYTTTELLCVLPFDRAAICRFARKGYLKSAKEKLENGHIGYVYKKEDIKTFLRDNDFYPYGDIHIIDTMEEVEPTIETVTDEPTMEEENASSASIIIGALVIKKTNNRFGFDFTTEKSYNDNLNVAYGALSRLAQALKTSVSTDWTNSNYPTVLDWVEAIMKNLCSILTEDFPIDNYRRYLWERTKLEIALFNKQFDRLYPNYGYNSPFINANQNGTETISIEIVDAIIR